MYNELCSSQKPLLKNNWEIWCTRGEHWVRWMLLALILAPFKHCDALYGVWNTALVPSPSGQCKGLLDLWSWGGKSSSVRMNGEKGLVEEAGLGQHEQKTHVLGLRWEMISPSMHGFQGSVFHASSHCDAVFSVFWDTDPSPSTPGLWANPESANFSHTHRRIGMAGARWLVCGWVSCSQHSQVVSCVLAGPSTRSECWWLIMLWRDLRSIWKCHMTHV